MDKESAKELFKALASMESPIGFLSGLLSKESEEDWKKLSHSISDLFKGHFEIMLYLSSKYPELDPDGAGKSNYESLKKQYDAKLFRNWE